MCKNGKNKVKPQKVKQPKRVSVDIYTDPDKARFCELFKRHHPKATNGGQPC